MIRITKASAGSGKTYTLAKHYITLLLTDRRKDAFRHILAVTFTNKATEEMKRRIIKELHVLATTPERSDYFEAFVPSLAKDAESLRKKSAGILSAILNDYGSFAISTIDKFFQQTLRAFSREIGQLASYKVELDRDSLIRESVSRLLDGLTPDRKDDPVLQWLLENALSFTESGERANYDRKLEEYALKLYGQQFSAALEKSGLKEDDFLSPESVKSTREKCRAFRKSLIDKIEGCAKKVSEEYGKSGIPSSAISYFDTSIGTICRWRTYDSPGKLHIPSQRVNSLADGSSGWFKKGRQYAVSAGFEEAVRDFVDCFSDDNIKAYKTVGLIEKQFYGLGLAKAIKDEFEALVKELNVLNIDDSNSILRSIIDDSDAPFVYEKVGVRYDRFLLDEFQDTSNIQWQNFLPLLRESVSKAGDEFVGGDDLIVGDVKQSIYRWRDSDWRLLQDEVKKTFGRDADDTVSLNTNFRSYGNVIRFNNDFFTKSARWVDECAGEKGYDAAETIYRDVAQNIRKGNEDGGYVSIRFASSHDEEREKVREAVAEARAAGYREKDIAVLCRNHTECGICAYDLISEGYNVITTASLKVSASPVIGRMTALLSLLDDPDDSIAKYYCSSLDVKLPEHADSLTDLCEDLLRKMKEAGEDIDVEIPYIECFLDLVLDYSTNYGNDLHGFLAWYDSKAGNTFISQPGDTDAISIMTIHKSKGLEFPVVIIPFAETIALRLKQQAEKWVAPSVKGTPIEGVADGIYSVEFQCSKGTCFDKPREEELRMARIDGLNDAYVAFTRAEEALFIISLDSKPEDDGQKEGCRLENMNDYLRKYVDETGTDTSGELRKCSCKVDHPAATLAHTNFQSWPLNPEHVLLAGNGGEVTDIREGGRLKFSTDSVDFFDEEGNAGARASRRIRGIVLHNILSKVIVPGDLPEAVREAVGAGELSEDEASEVERRLKDGIAGKSEFFPENPAIVYNEVSLMDSDGSISRPDRVVDDGENVLIIDYKFGAERKSYRDQIERYKSLYEAMGRKNVKAELWYVDRD